MKRFVLLSGMLLGLGVCVGCGPKLPDPAESTFEGEDLEKQMEAMEAAGKAEVEKANAQ